MSESVEIRIVAKAKNAILARFADECGGVKYAADSLGISPATYGNWLNFKSAPKPGGVGAGGMRHKRLAEIIIKLEKLTGRSIRDIFPLTKKHMRLLERARVTDKTIPHENLLDYVGSEPRELTYEPTQEVDADRSLLRERMSRVLQTLSFIERQVIKCRYGIPAGTPLTLEETARVFKITRERVRKIEMKAIRKLQEPSRSQEVIGFA